MKKELVFALLISPLLTFAQAGNFKIVGKAGNYNAPAKVFLNYKLNGKNVTDSTILKNGAFEFKGSINAPLSANLILDHKGTGFQNLDFKTKQDVFGVYLEKGTINISSPDSLLKSTVTGSKLNEESRNLQNMLKPLEAKMRAFNNDYQSASEEQKASSVFNLTLQTRYENIQKQQKEILKKFIQNNLNSYVSLDALRAIAGENPEYSEVEPLFSSLSPELKKTAFGKALAANLANGKNVAIGAAALDFTQSDVNGKPVKLSDFKGKYVLLDFWASWCGPCRQENPNVVKVFNKFKDKNFTVLGVSLDRENGKKAWLKAIEDDKLAWTHVSDLKFWNNKVAVLYGIQSIPQNFLLDPDGKIIAKNLRGEDLDRKLSELIK
jgi:peroxiredoxin